MALEVPAHSALAIDDATIEALRASLGGGAAAAGRCGYDDARHDLQRDDRPPPGADRALRRRRRRGQGGALRPRARAAVVSVRGGGHNVAGNAVCEGGLMIDLTPMKGIRVDPAARTVRGRRAALTWREFDRETQAFGLATTGGAISIDRHRRADARRRLRLAGPQATAWPATT